MSFAKLSHYAQVEPHLSKEFGIAKKHNLTYISYKRVLIDTFPLVPQQQQQGNLLEYERALIRLEMRGLVFDNRTQVLTSRSLHKFFNIGEREDSKSDIVEKLMKTQNYVLLEKLDGSMSAAILEPVAYYKHPTDPTLVQVVKRLRIRSKMGYDNPVGMAAEKYIYGHTVPEKMKHVVTMEPAEPAPEKLEDGTVPVVPDCECSKQGYVQFCVDFILKGYTPIFEYFSHDNRIVVNYSKEFLQLIAIRHVYDGHYIPYPEMIKLGQTYNVEVVVPFELDQPFTNIGKMIQAIKASKHREGCVIRFDDGSMFKLKCTWYTDLHHLKSELKYEIKEQSIWKMVLDNNLDDHIALLSTEEEKQQLRIFNDALYQAIAKRAAFLQQIVKQGDAQCANQKEFADYIAKQLENEPKALKGAAFRIKNSNEDAEDVITQMVSSCCMKDLEGARALLAEPTLKWQAPSFDFDDYKLKQIQKSQDLMKKIATDE